MDNSFRNQPTIHVRNAVIEEITSNRDNTFVTIFYTDCENCRQNNQTVRLVVSNRTRIFDENGNRIPARNLRVGMTVDASFSSAMTRSIPPQANAYMIQITQTIRPEIVTVGRIIEINRQNRNFTAISDGNLSSIVRFNVPPNTPIIDRLGRPVNFSRLTPGMRVQVRHASFMTASIPPQTTAFEIRIL